MTSTVLTLRDYFAYYIAGLVWLVLATLLIVGPIPVSDLKVGQDALGTPIIAVLILFVPYVVGFALSGVGTFATKSILAMVGDPQWLVVDPWDPDHQGWLHWKKHGFRWRLQVDRTVPKRPAPRSTMDVTWREYWRGRCVAYQWIGWETIALVGKCVEDLLKPLGTDAEYLRPISPRSARKPDSATPSSRSVTNERQHSTHSELDPNLKRARPVKPGPLDWTASLFGALSTRLRVASLPSARRNKQLGPGADELRRNLRWRFNLIRTMVRNSHQTSAELANRDRLLSNLAESLIVPLPAIAAVVAVRIAVVTPAFGFGWIGEIGVLLLILLVLAISIAGSLLLLGHQYLYLREWETKHLYFTLATVGRQNLASKPGQGAQPIGRTSARTSGGN